MISSLASLKVGMSGLSGNPNASIAQNNSFENILAETRSASGLSGTTPSMQSIQGLLSLQRDLYGVHLRVEMVSKVADGALSTARRLQQGQ